MAFGFFRKQKNIADKIFFNAKVFTMDSVLPWAEAVAVRDGKIIAVGHYEEMEDLTGEDTELIDLEEAYMLPGFIDIHRSPVIRTIKEKYGQDADIGEQESEISPELDEDYRFDPFNMAGLNLPDIDEIISADLDEPLDKACDKADEDEVASNREDNIEEAEGYSEEDDEYYEPGSADEAGEVIFEIDHSEFDEAIRETLSELAGQGVTTVLNLKTPHEIESEFEERLIEFYTDDKLNLRFMGALYLNIPVPGIGVKSMLSQRRGMCSELDDMIRNEVLYIELDNSANREKITQQILEDIMLEASDRGFIIFVEAFGYEEMLLAYRASDTVRSKGYKNNIIIASDHELKERDRAELSSDASIYKTWGSNIDAEGFFNGNISDTEEAIEHLTVRAAEMIGMEDELGSAEKGKYADFAIFSDDPTKMSVTALVRQGALKTVISGEIVYDAEDENNDFMLEMIMSQHN